ncbi:hypothetical protein [Deinococcus planocerae]|uniref:hypothetical protein n=1 Tax=Deinococcus planocerae TaxID=1737569 RepID=UPI000C7F6D4D|nr:hypothetical protein [Deinococcus planocerae]
MVAVNAEETGGRLWRQRRQLAGRLHGELHVTAVRPFRLSSEQSRILGTFRTITGALGGGFSVLESAGGLTAALVRFVQDRHAAQVVMGETSLYSSVSLQVGADSLLLRHLGARGFVSDHIDADLRHRQLF